MRVLLIGGTDPLTQLIATHARDGGHDVTVLESDIMPIGAIDAPMVAQQAVICCLDSNFSAATEIVLRAMQRHNVRRIICVIYGDKSRQEELVSASDRDWVIVRPARLTDGMQRRQYAVVLNTTALKATSISRADAAEFVTSQLKRDKYLYKSPVLTN